MAGELGAFLGGTVPSSNVDDRRAYEWGSNPGREALATILGVLGGGERTGAITPPFGGQQAGVIENQLGLGDIPNPSPLGQVLGMAQKVPDYFNEYFLGRDPEKSAMGEALMRHGTRRYDEQAIREMLMLSGNAELTPEQKAYEDKWLRVRGHR
jgi:hypothetical protein